MALKYTRRTYKKTPTKLNMSPIQSLPIPYQKPTEGYFTDSIRVLKEGGSFICSYECSAPEYSSSTVSKGLYLTFVVSGKGYCNGVSYTARDLFIIHPNSNKDIRSDKNDPWEIYWCAWKGSSAERPLSMLTNFKENTPYHISNQSNLSLLFDFMIYSIHVDQNINDSIHAFTNLIISNFLFVSNPNINNKKIDDINMIKDYIERNYSTITVTNISNFFHMDRKYISYIFKQTTGITMKNYIQRIKLSHAEELLLSKKYSINDVAMNVGFKNYSTFIQAFKKEYSLTPSDFLKKHFS